MTDSTPKSYNTDPALYLYTSLTSGSSHIVTATSRLETILKANKIPFKAIDIATDEKARMLWGRRAGKDESGRARKLPGLVQEGLVVGDLVEIEDWNEYGELKEHVAIVHDGATPARSAAQTPLGTPSKPPAPQEKKPEISAPASSKAPEISKLPAGGIPTSLTSAMHQVGQEAAQKAKDAKKKVVETLSGTGEAETAKKETDRPVAEPAITTGAQSPDTHSVETTTLLQSPTSTAWKREPETHGSSTPPPHSIEALESLQSPTSTTWKPVDTDLPILSHRGSNVSQASAEEIKRIEEEEAIPEVDEDAIAD